MWLSCGFQSVYPRAYGVPSDTRLANDESLGIPPRIRVSPQKPPNRCRRRGNTPVQAGISKERTFESTFVIELRKPRKQPKPGTRRSKKTSSPVHTAKIEPQRPAKASGKGKTTMAQKDNPEHGTFELVAQVPGQVKFSGPPRKRRAPRPRRGKVEQRRLPSVPASDHESKA